MSLLAGVAILLAILLALALLDLIEAKAEQMRAEGRRRRDEDER